MFGAVEFGVPPDLQNDFQKSLLNPRRETAFRDRVFLRRITSGGVTGAS